MSDVRKSQKNVLIVDDIEDNRVLLERTLRSAGYAVQSADCGASAIAIVSDARPDIILLDWMMPGLSGLETLIQIRKDYSASQLPIIMCTAMGEEHDVVQAIEAGANDYVVKPISLPILRARMSTHLAQSERVTTLESESHLTKKRAAEQLRRLMEARSV
ncbi:response regulator transcription factor [Altererythrobacter sp. CAU 1778]